MAFFIKGEKYACSPCIRGHRVKKCNHEDRQLIPVLKRGRQVSQCTHCRDLRKTNQTHVKCTCAISSTPNPINGCLCELLLTCNCVAHHLQEIQPEDNLVVADKPNTPLSEEHTPDAAKDLMNSELSSFFKNDLDKHLV